MNSKKAKSGDGKVSSVDLLLKSMADRDPKKRKVKPNSKGHDLMYLDLLDDSSSDDEEYLPKSKDIAAAEKDDDIDLDDDEDDPDADEDDEEDDSEDEEIQEKSRSPQKTSSQNDLSITRDDYLKGSNDQSVFRAELPSKVIKLLVCSICLGDVSHEADEIVECDSCGITVHEACYGVTNDTDADSVHSNASSASTEPWFCDSCLANVTYPVCDLCPNTGGIFKQTDVKRWVHLVCALYIPGVAFNDTSRLSGVTLFELGYERWGARTCTLCEDERVSRTGVCVSCDAGLCKTYFHVTCAQSHGLLAEAQSTEETELVDPFYAHCKVHAGDKLSVKAKRRNWLALQSKMKLRRQQQLEKPLNERTVRKLLKARIKWAEIEETKHPSWIPSKKLPRLLTTSSSAIKKLIKKAELLGMSPQTPFLAAHDVDIRKKWHLPPAFSVEFVSYYLDRNNRMSSMQKRVEELKDQCRQLKLTETTTRQQYEELTNLINECKIRNTQMKESGKHIYRLLGDLVKKELPTPKLFSDNLIDERGPEDSATGDRTGESADSSPSNLLVECGICHRSHDFQKLALCDSCKLHYHLYCLDPPLKRMPKKTRFGGWQCSDCTEKEEEEAEEEAISAAESRSEYTGDSFEQTPSKRRRLREHVKSPNKFIPDAEPSSTNNTPVQKKKGPKKKRKIRKSKTGRPKKDSTNQLNESGHPMNHSINCGASVSLGPNNSLLVSLKPKAAKVPVKLEAECCKCGNISKTTSLVQCDQCLLYYHLECCNPPLKKNPRKKGYKWYCEECDNSEDAYSDEEGEDNRKDTEAEQNDDGEEEDVEEIDRDEGKSKIKVENVRGGKVGDRMSANNDYSHYSPNKHKDSHYNYSIYQTQSKHRHGATSSHLKEDGKLLIRFKQNGSFSGT